MVQVENGGKAAVELGGLTWPAEFCHILPRWSNWPITIFHPRDGKSPLARLALAPWRPSRSDLRPTRSTVWKAAQKAPRGGVFLCNSFASYGSIFQVPPVSDYSTWCTNAYLRVRCTSLLFTRLVHQPLFTRWCTNHLLTRHWLIRGRRISI